MWVGKRKCEFGNDRLCQPIEEWSFRWILFGELRKKFPRSICFLSSFSKGLPKLFFRMPSPNRFWNGFENLEGQRTSLLAPSARTRPIARLEEFQGFRERRSVFAKICRQNIRIILASVIFDPNDIGGINVPWNRFFLTSQLKKIHFWSLCFWISYNFPSCM